MDVLVYFGSIGLLVLLASVFPRYDRAFALAVAAVLVLFSGLRSGGFDYEEYLMMIEAFRGEGGVVTELDTLLRVKDPLFGVIVSIVDALNAGDVWIFLTLSVLAVSTKVIYASSMPARSTILLGLYAFFIAPGLEFAAIRAGAAIGFLALTADPRRSRRSRIALFFLAVASHISVIVGGVLLLFRSKLTTRNVLIFAVIVTTVTYFVLSSFFSLIPQDLERFAEYEDQGGTIRALIPPVATIAILIGFVPLEFLQESNDFAPARTAYVLALGFACFALGAALPVVTASTRFLEMSWFFSLALLVQMTIFQDTWRTRLGLAALLGLLSIVNVLRMTWTALTDLGVLGG